jgi:flagellar biosynthetic protein FliR
MDLFHFSMTQFQVFLLAFSRVAAMMFSMPVIGGKLVPVHFRIGLALMITLILLPLSPIDPADLSGNLPALIIALIGEAMIGVLIGFTATLVFAAVEMAGELIGFQMGFSVINVIDPERGIPVPILGQFYSIMAMLIFLSINAHYYFIQSIGSSFFLIPLFHFDLSPSFLAGFISLAGEMFILAVKIGAPVVVAIFITNIAMNIVSRTVPQMNILVVGFPVTIAVGFLVMAMSVGVFGYLMTGVFQELGGNVGKIMMWMGT